MPNSRKNKKSKDSKKPESHQQSRSNKHRDPKKSNDDDLSGLYSELRSSFLKSSKSLKKSATSKCDKDGFPTINSKKGKKDKRNDCDDFSDSDCDDSSCD